MRKYIMTIATLALCSACVEPDYYKIDANCTPEEIAAIERAVEKINDGAGEDFFAISEVVEIDYDAPLGRVFICTSDTEATLARWPFLEGKVGRRSGDSIIIRTDLMNSHDVESTTMHELIHKLGASNDEHSANGSDVFCGHWVPNSALELSEVDLEIIKKHTN